MKSTLAILLLILLGVALGVGTASLRIGSAPWDVKLHEDVKTVSGAAPHAHGPVAKVRVRTTEYDFGVLDMRGGSSHDFVFTNVGDAPLKLASGATSCRCTVSKLDRERIPPGGSGTVTLTWKPINVPGSATQTAKILTNDPDRPVVELTIFGKISATMRLTPSELVFSRLTTGETATDDARLLYYLTEPLKILGHTWSDPATAQFYEAALQPLSAEQLKQEPSVREGWQIKVTVKPGLPQGPSRQTLLLQTNMASSPEVALPIQVMVGSEITVAGPGWDSDNGVLNLGEILSDTGLHRRLILVVRGPQRKEVKFTSVRADPSVLKVTLGQPSPINNGAVVQVPLTIDVPQGSPPVNHLGSEQGKLGKIIVETTHPQVPKLIIRVRFAIEG